MINNRMKIEPQVQAHELNRVHRVGRLQVHKTLAVSVMFATHHRVYSGDPVSDRLTKRTIPEY